MKIDETSIHYWIQQNKIKTEKGKDIDFIKHRFLYDIYSDFSQKQVICKAAQIGLSTLQILKALFLAKNYNIDIIYTLPTDSDVNVFVGGKVNRIIKQNSVLQEYTKDKDNVEQKKIGDAMTYWRGTFTKRAAISVTSDLNIHDEVDFSDQQIIEDYQSRLQHSDYAGEWYFGHPSTEGVGVAKHWDNSDKKHWFITCSYCNKKQFMSFPESVCENRGIFQCKFCKKEITNRERRFGEWVKKHNNKDFSGYWVPLLIAPWIDAKYILKKHYDNTEEYFYNRVLGLPYVGSGNKVTKNIIIGNLTTELNEMKGRVIIGVDTGTYLRYVCGNKQGLFYFGEVKDDRDKNGKLIKSKYDEIEKLMNRWKSSIVVFDQGGGPGDSVAVRELREKYPGRVFLAFYREDRKTSEVIKYDDDKYTVTIDRNKAIQMVIDEFADRRIPIMGNESEWWDYWLHWDKIYRVCEETALGTKKYKWLRSGRDDWVHATIYWRAGMDRFSNGEGIIFK